MKPYAAALIYLVVTGCSLAEKQAPVPAFPSASQVSALAISHGLSVNDRAAIDSFVSNLHSLKGTWEYTWHTYPTPQTTVSLVGQSSGEVLCRIDIGPNWLGSTCGHVAKGWPPYIHLTEAQTMKFRELVGSSSEAR